MLLPRICVCNRKKCMWASLHTDASDDTIPYEVLMDKQTSSFLIKNYGVVYPKYKDSEAANTMVNAIKLVLDESGYFAAFLKTTSKMCQDGSSSKAWVNALQSTCELMWTRCLIMSRKVSYMHMRSWSAKEVFRLLYPSRYSNLDLLKHAETLLSCVKRMQKEITVLMSVHEVNKCENHNNCLAGWLVPTTGEGIKCLICPHCKDEKFKFCTMECFQFIWYKKHRHECTNKPVLDLTHWEDCTDINELD